MSDSHALHAELGMLREFYVAWVDMHKIPRDKLHRNKQEAAAQELVDCGHQLARFYRLNTERDPRPTGLSANG